MRETMPDAEYPHRHRPTHHAPVERFNEPMIVQVNVCTKDRQPLLQFDPTCVTI